MSVETFRGFCFLTVESKSHLDKILAVQDHIILGKKVLISLTGDGSETGLDEGREQDQVDE